VLGEREEVILCYDLEMPSIRSIFIAHSRQSAQSLHDSLYYLLYKLSRGQTRCDSIDKVRHRHSRYVAIEQACHKDMYSDRLSICCESVVRIMPDSCFMHHRPSKSIKGLYVTYDLAHDMSGSGHRTRETRERRLVSHIRAQSTANSKNHAMTTGQV